MPAFLVPVDPGQCLIPLEKAVVLIGRQADCDVSLTHSRKISRKHCCIAQVNNKFIVRDLGSTNGVFLNGNRIEKEAELAIGDQLTIGDVRFKVQNEAPINEKKKVIKRAADETKPIDEPVGRPPAPAVRRPQQPPPSMDIPVAIEDSGPEFQVESTKQSHPNSPRKRQAASVEDSDEIDDDDQNQPFRLAPDH